MVGDYALVEKHKVTEAALNGVWLACW